MSSWNDNFKRGLILVVYLGVQYVLFQSSSTAMRHYLRSWFTFQIFGVYLAILYFLLFHYIWNRLITVFNSNVLKTYCFYVYSVLAMSCFFLGEFIGGGDYPNPITYVAWICWGSMWIMASIFGIFDLVYWAIGWEKEIIPSTNKLKRLKTFTKKQWKAIIVVSISFLLSIASFLHGTETPKVNSFEITLDKLHPSMDNFRIVQLTDIHIGPTAGKAFIRDVVEATNALRPDLIVISGDLADGRFSIFRDSISPIKDLKAMYGTYYVTGNHEYISGAAAEWTKQVEDLGVKPLRNEHVLIGPKNTGFILAGVEDWTSTNYGIINDLTTALDGADKNREVVVVAHQPKHIFESVFHNVGLQLSGHTHAGQMWPFHLFVWLGNPYFSGLYQHPNSRTQIYVSPGTRHWGPPMRIFTHAEITEIVLRAKK